MKVSLVICVTFVHYFNKMPVLIESRHTFDQLRSSEIYTVNIRLDNTALKINSNSKITCDQEGFQQYYLKNLLLV